MLVHGAVKTHVYRAILLNHVFTVPQICAWTGLNRDQVYPVLAKLKHDRILLSESLHADKKEGGPPAHRPLSVYKLTEDPERRRALADEIAPFLRLAEIELPAPTSDAYERARTALDQVDKDLDALATTIPDDWAGEKHLQSLREGLAGAKEDLEIAWRESTESQNNSLRPRIEGDLSRIEQYSQRIKELHDQLEAIREQREAERQFSKLLTGIFSRIKRMEPIRVKERLAREYSATDQLALKGILSRVAAELESLIEMAPAAPRSLEPKATLSFLLAESSIRYGNDPKLSLKLVKEVLRRGEGEHEVTKYNFANICALAGRTDLAFEEWRSTLDSLQSSISRETELSRILGVVFRSSVFTNTLLGFVRRETITSDTLEELEREIGLSGALSIIGVHPLKRPVSTPYVLRPSFVDWFDPASYGFPLSDSLLIKQPQLYIYGPLEDAVKFPGLPTLRLATGLVSLSVPPEDAWAFANRVQGGETLLLIHGTRRWNSLTVSRLERKLPAGSISRFYRR